ncbi:hypothetical protein K466DRAFT_597852 [Polyporus arcularius HHB13444]|uniref:Transmembrane protein n=1 Tax=Polyporus arcularius HHB13444 TaxID=1314778 RepID=A0A5C3PJD2_9APHY|nr:hypothetical protein K466DRAFT_597852 [Polyporus arcularius HHB13444]
MSWQPPQPRLAILPVSFQDAGGQYTVLPTSDSDSNSDTATLAEDEDPSKPQPQPISRDAHAVDLESLQVEVPATPPSRSWSRAISSAVWHTRMLLVLFILCTAATLVAGEVLVLIGNLAGLAWCEPYTSMINAGWREWQACAVGAGVLGCAIGLLGFAHLVLSSPARSYDDEPELDSELQWALPVAALGGVLALAVGVAVVPGLAVESFGVRQAVAVGFWGLGAPLAPMGVCMFASTLWTCDPCAGAECFCEGCCRR